MTILSAQLQNTFRLRIESLEAAWNNAPGYIRNLRYNHDVVQNSESLVGFTNTTFGSVPNLFMLFKGSEAPTPQDDVVAQALLISSALKPALTRA